MKKIVWAGPAGDYIKRILWAGDYIKKNVWAGTGGDYIKIIVWAGTGSDYIKIILWAGDYIKRIVLGGYRQVQAVTK